MGYFYLLMLGIQNLTDMKRVNRKQPPIIQQVDTIVLPKVQAYALDNGIPVYALTSGTQEVLKLELVFDAGRPKEVKKGVSRATMDMLKEGTSTRLNKEISAQVDYFGTYIGTQFNLDNNTIGFYCLKKYFKALLPILADIIFDPIFPEEELNAWRDNAKQKLKVDLERSDVVAYRVLTEQIFGANHAYGYNSSTQVFDAIKRADLVEHYKRNYTASNCKIFLTGKVDDGVVNLVNQHFGKPFGMNTKANDVLSWVPKSPQVSKINMKAELQSSVRMGMRLFNKAHEDYKDLYVMNQLFGGYFGSRLMMNIREEQGLTYNIYSSIDPFRYDGYFYIGSDTSAENVGQVVDSIFHEMEHLKSDPVSTDELDMLRNYLMGSFLAMLDGPFNAGEVVKSYLTEDLEMADFEALINKVRTINQEEIMAMANKYLNPSDFEQVIVGNP